MPDSLKTDHWRRSCVDAVTEVNAAFLCLDRMDDFCMKLCILFLFVLPIRRGSVLLAPFKGTVHPKIYIQFHSPQNIPGASRHNSILLNNWSRWRLDLKQKITTKRTHSGSVQLVRSYVSPWRPWDPKFIWEEKQCELDYKMHRRRDEA